MLVIGGTSKIGAALLRELRGGGVPARALVRSQRSAETVRALGVQPVHGDLAQPTTVEEAMRGAQRVFLLSSPHPDADRWHTAAIDAARRAGVGSLVRLSVLGADPSSPARMARQHGLADHHLARSGVPHTILRPNYFAQNVLETVAPSVDPDGNLYASVGAARLSMVDTDDVAAVAAHVLTGTGHEGRVYNLTGPEALSYADVAARLAARSGRPVRYVDVPDDAVHAALTGLGMDPWTVEAVVELYASYRASGPGGWAARVTGTVQALTGRAPRSLDQVLRAADLAVTA